MPRSRREGCQFDAEGEVGGGGGAEGEVERGEVVFCILVGNVAVSIGSLFI